MEMTVPELKTAIKAAGGSYKSRDLKATLVRKWNMLRARASLEYPEMVNWKQAFQMDHRRRVLSTTSKFQVSMYIPPTIPLPRIIAFLDEQIQETKRVKHSHARYGVVALVQVKEYLSRLQAIPPLGLVIFSRGDEDNLLFKAYTSKKLITNLIYEVDARFNYLPQYIE